jgi:hypothetical protein
MKVCTFYSLFTIRNLFKFFAYVSFFCYYKMFSACTNGNNFSFINFSFIITFENSFFLLLVERPIEAHHLSCIQRHARFK